MPILLMSILLKTVDFDAVVTQITNSGAVKWP